jgi:hypothetical protein
MRVKLLERPMWHTTLTFVATPSTQTSCRSVDEASPRGLDGVPPTGPEIATLIRISVAD